MKKIVYAILVLILFFTIGCVRKDAHPAAPEPPVIKECEVDSDCKIGGCNGEICAAEKMFSICLAKPEFACYKLTECKCLNGKCGWEQTPGLLDCLAQYR